YLPVTPRLQRFYTLEATGEQITWHANNQTEERSMCHPFDSDEWRHFERAYLHSSVQPRNIRLGLCTDGLATHKQYGRTYSCWPVILTPYNLPLGMCMSSEYMFVVMVITDPSNPKHLIDVLPGAADRGVAESVT
ncbi:UNVERIFIED_CONTAM: hypothetical protein Sindi_0496300, partial [Sesamum indicum]